MTAKGKHDFNRLTSAHSFVGEHGKDKWGRGDISSSIAITVLFHSAQHLCFVALGENRCYFFLWFPFSCSPNGNIKSLHISHFPKEDQKVRGSVWYSLPVIIFLIFSYQGELEILSIRICECLRNFSVWNKYIYTLCFLNIKIYSIH